MRESVIRGTTLMDRWRSNRKMIHSAPYDMTYEARQHPGGGNCTVYALVESQVWAGETSLALGTKLHRNDSKQHDAMLSGSVPAGSSTTWGLALKSFRCFRQEFGRKQIGAGILQHGRVKGKVAAINTISQGPGSAKRHESAVFGVMPTSAET